jgi:regulator of protease activity HflC (stomatin/prohibitin superfamily)
MQVHLDEGTDPWGVKVERVEMLVIQINNSFLDFIDLFL